MTWASKKTTSPMTTSAAKGVFGSLALAAASLLLLVSCSRRPPSFRSRFDFSGPTMGTRYTVRLAPGEGEGVLATRTSTFLQKQVDERLAGDQPPDVDVRSKLGACHDSIASTATDWFEFLQETAEVVARH